MYFLASAEALKRSATVYVCVYFVQSLDHFNALTMPWPREWQIVFSVMSVFNFDLQQARLDCFEGWGGMRNFVALQLSLPLLMACIYTGILFCYMLLLWAARVRRLTPPIEALVRLQASPRLAKAVDRTIGAYVALLSLMYPMLCKVTFQLFSCRDIDKDLGISFLDANPALECFGPEHQKLIPVGVVSLLFYVLGYPIFTFYLLIQAVRTNSLDHPVFKQRFGSLYLRYERWAWWWEFVVMFRRFVSLLLLVMASRYELLQVAAILLVYFFAVVAQDNARPYDRELVDNFEFLQLLTCHFVLLLGLVWHGAGKTLEVATTCDSSNGTVVSVECTHEDTKRRITTQYQFLASLLILFCLVASMACGGTTIWVQAHTVIKKKLRVKEVDEQDVKFEAMMDLAKRVMAADALPATREWLIESTPSEREYFKHLLNLLDQNYEDYVALQHKNMQDFFERSQEQLIGNLSFLATTCGGFFQLICGLRRPGKKNTIVQKNIADPQGGLAPQQQQPEGKKSRFSFLRSRKKREKEAVRKKDTPTGQKIVDDEDDDLVEAYLRSRQAAQEREERENATAQRL